FLLSGWWHYHPGKTSDILVKLQHYKVDLMHKNVHVILGCHPTFRKKQEISAKPVESTPHYDTHQ
ncbi:hypothetical protein AVEN_132309-1, partial [Araneus ventricosus]